LIASAVLGQTSAAKVLIAAGADVNAQLSSGQTALAIARKAGHTEFVQVLQQAGARE
jgi:ankyrin repeat protein